MTAIGGNRACLRNKSAPDRCLLTFAKAKGGWRLVGMQASDLRIEADRNGSGAAVYGACKRTAPMLLHLSTWAEIEGFLTRSKTVVIPIGSNEQHGPTGLLGTDWLCPEIIAHEAQKTGDILIAPTFNIGMAQHHLDFPGTIALRPSTFMLAIGDWVRSLAHHGFEKIYFLNGHGGNTATIDAAFSELYSEVSYSGGIEFSYSGGKRGFACKQKNWWELKGIANVWRLIKPPAARKSRSGTTKDWIVAAEGHAIDALGQFVLKTSLGAVGASVNFTQSNLMMILAGGLILALLYFGARPRAVVPGRLQALAEI
eukprot:gene2649-3606_t